MYPIPYPLYLLLFSSLVFSFFYFLCFFCSNLILFNFSSTQILLHSPPFHFGLPPCMARPCLCID